MKNRLKKLIAPIIAVIGGVVFIVLGCVGISHVQNFPEIEVTVSTVDIDTRVDSDGTTTEDITVYVTYTVDGKEYNEVLQDASGDIKEGDKITVHYNPEKPSYVTGATKKSSITRIIIGAVLGLIGLASFFLIIIRGR